MTTYVLRASHPEWDETREASIADLVAGTIGNHGATVHATTGIWRGLTEPGVVIEIEASCSTVDAIIERLRQEGCEHVHVEESEPVVRYV